MCVCVFMYLWVNKPFLCSFSRFLVAAYGQKPISIETCFQISSFRVECPTNKQPMDGTAKKYALLLHFISFIRSFSRVFFLHLLRSLLPSKNCIHMVNLMIFFFSLIFDSIHFIHRIKCWPSTFISLAIFAVLISICQFFFSYTFG